MFGVGHGCGCGCVGGGRTYERLREFDVRLVGNCVLGNGQRGQMVLFCDWPFGKLYDSRIEIRSLTHARHISKLKGKNICIDSGHI